MVSGGRGVGQMDDSDDCARSRGRGWEAVDQTGS
jgi:hypothetical protein